MFVCGNGTVTSAVPGTCAMYVSVIVPSLIIVVFHLSRGQSPTPTLTSSPFGNASKKEVSENDHDG